MPTRKENIEKIMESIQAIRRYLIAKSFKNSPKIMGHEERWMSPSQWAVVSIVMKQADLGIKDISRMLGITSSATTQLVNASVLKGFLVRKKSEKDRRALVLELSASWKKRAEEMKSRSMKQWTNALNTLSDDEIALYLKLNTKIAQKFGDLELK